MVYKSFLTRSSKFIEAALARDWKEAREKRIAIPDHDPTAFEGYLNWIYSKRITLKDNETLCECCEQRDPKKAECVDSQSLERVTMLLLGDYLDDAEFCNAVIDDYKSIMSITEQPKRYHDFSPRQMKVCLRL